ncbi:MAG: hypothetical protein L0Z62_24520 [Gemmataceae bacterium]|nr:hypothetical protein [Gemmataceae bacterium]
MIDAMSRPVKSDPTLSAKAAFGASDKPALPVKFDTVPDSLQQFRGWVLWRWEWRTDKDGTRTRTKVPYGLCRLPPGTKQHTRHFRDRETGEIVFTVRTKGRVTVQRAATNRPTSGMSYASAAKIYQENPGVFSGVGLILTEDMGLVVIDLDDARDPDTGELADWAWPVVDKLDTYSEVSPSGTGVKVYVWGKKPGRNCGTKKGSPYHAEMYSRLRWVALTGINVEGTPTTVEARQEAITEVYELFFPGDLARAQERQAAASAHTANGTAHAACCPPHRSTAPAGDRQGVLDAAAKYVDRIGPAISGQRGSATTCNVCCKLLGKFGLSMDEAWPILLQYNARSVPPWSEHELRRRLEWADQQPGPRGTWRSDRWADVDAELAGLDVDNNITFVLPRNAKRSTPDIGHEVTAMHTEEEQVKRSRQIESTVEACAEISRDAARERAEEERLSAAMKPTVHRCCPRQRKIQQRHKTHKNQSRTLAVRCKAGDCPGCGPMLREKWVRSMFVHFMGVRGPIISILTIPRSQWEALRKRITRHGHHAAAVDLPGDEMTVYTSMAIDDADMVTPLEAARQFAELLHSLPPTRKPVHTSREWKLLDEDDERRKEYLRRWEALSEKERRQVREKIKEKILAKNPETTLKPKQLEKACIDSMSEWETIGPVGTQTLAEAVEIVEANGLRVQHKEPRPGSWIQGIVEWQCPPNWSQERIDHLAWQLSIGETVPYWGDDAECNGDQADPDG